MSGSLHGRSLLATRMRNVLVVIGTRIAPLHLPSNPSSNCLLLPHPPSLCSPARQYTPRRASPRQACLLKEASFLHSVWFSTSPVALKTRPKVDGDHPDAKRKEDKSPMITLIDDQDKVSSMSLGQAERLAKRRDFKLVKIEDPDMKKGSMVYRLMTGKQYFMEQVKAKRGEMKPSTGVKDEKILAIGGKITPHDLAVKLQNVSKWLSKGHQVKVTISSRKATKEEVENVVTIIEEEAKKVKGRILQRHEKMDDIRFYIAPPKDMVKKETNTETVEEGDHVHSEESSDHTK